MTNREWFYRWTCDAIGRMDDHEFGRFVLAFIDGYKDEKHEITCVDVCGHCPDDACENCAERTQEWLRKEHVEDA